MKTRIIARIAIAILAASPVAADTRTVEIRDAQGFEREIVAYTLEVPRDWQVSGQILWQKPCSGNDLYELVLTARAPDGRTGLRIMPGHQVIWNDAVLGGMDPYFEQLMKAQIEAQRNELRTRFKGSNCHVAHITDPENLFRTLVLAKRPADTRIVSSQPDQAMRQSFAQSLGPSQPGLAVSYDAVNVEMAYSLNGAQVVERMAFSWYMFTTEFRDPTMHSLSQHTVVNALQFDWIAPERRAADDAVLKRIASSFRANPDWQRRVREVQQKLADDRRRNNEETRQQRELERKQRELQNDEQHRQFLQYLRE